MTRLSTVVEHARSQVISDECGTPEGTFPFRYLSEKKLKQRY